MMNLKKLISKSETTSQLLKAMAHPQRLMILCYLSDGPKTVSEIQKFCSLSQSLASQFLNKMRLEGLIKSEREGKYHFYSITDNKVSLLMKSLNNIFCN